MASQFRLPPVATGFEPGGRRAGLFPACAHTVTQKETTMSPAAGMMLTNEVLPILTTTIPRVVKAIGSEDPEELVLPFLSGRHVVDPPLQLLQGGHDLRPSRRLPENHGFHRLVIQP